jgi:hypothetical protein
MAIVQNIMAVDKPESLFAPAFANEVVTARQQAILSTQFISKIWKPTRQDSVYDFSHILFLATPSCTVGEKP